MENLAFRLDVWDDLEVRTALPVTGWVDVIGTAKAFINSDFAADMAATYESDRESAAVILDSANIAAGIGPFIQDISQQTGSTSASEVDQFRDIFDYMDQNAETVNSRELVFAAPVAGGGNVGNGEIRRLGIDDLGYQMQGWFTDTYTMEITEDSNQLGLQYEEVFTFEGTNASVDTLKRSGTGVSDEVTCWSERNTETFVQNPSFENFGGNIPILAAPTTPTSLAGWTPLSGSFANIEVQVDQLYRTPPGSQSSIAVTFTDNETLSQDLVAVNGTEIDQNVPYDVGIAVYRRNLCDGTFNYTLGGVTRAVAMGGLANGAYTWIWLVVTPGVSNWYEAFKANNLTLSYQLVGRTVGEMVLDGGLFGPYELVGGSEGVGRGAMGHYVFARSGTTPFVGGAGGLTGDTFAMTDTEAVTRAKNQYWLAEGEVGYLPSIIGGAETVLDK